MRMIDPEYEADDFEYIQEDEFDDFRREDEYPFGIPHDVLMELIGKDG